MPTTVWASWLCRAIVACNFGVEWGSGPHPLECSDIQCHCQAVVVNAFIPGFFSPTLPCDGAEKCLKAQKTSLHPSWAGESWTESTSMQTLSSSICGLKREISRKALEVITLDKKGICSGPRAADTSTFSYFWGPWSLKCDGRLEP